MGEGEGLAFRSQAACMKNRKLMKRRWPARWVRDQGPGETARGLASCCSLGVVGVGCYWCCVVLSTDAKRISEGKRRRRDEERDGREQDH